VENVKWVPMIYHGEQGNMGVYLLSDYTTEQAMKNPAYEKLDAPLDWMREESARVVNLLGDEFEIAG